MLCEKPVALKGADCARLANLAKAKQLTLKAAMSRRYLAPMMLARQMVRGGELGAIASVEVQDCVTFQWKPQSYAFFAAESGGVLADMGVHYLDFLDTLLGPLAPLDYCDDARGGTESSAVFRLRAGETPIVLRLSRLHAAGAFIRIIGERELVVDKSMETAVSFKPAHGPMRTISVDQPFDNPAWPTDFHGSFCQMLADFERAIAGQVTPTQTPPTPNGRAPDRMGLRAAALAGKVAGSPVLVTGATGFIGGHLVERLTGEGASVRTSVRSPTSLANRLGSQWICDPRTCWIPPRRGWRWPEPAPSTTWPTARKATPRG